MSMPKRFCGRSRTWPLLAATSKSGPRYLLIVLALAGDSTITRFFFFRVATLKPSVRSKSQTTSHNRRYLQSVFRSPCQGLDDYGREGMPATLLANYPSLDR